MNEVIRHGDVILETVFEIEGDVQRDVLIKASSVLAEGEVTSHKHVLNGQHLLSKVGSVQYVELMEEGQLSHEEHDTLTIPKGMYRVVIQREVDLLGEVRQVQD